MKKSCSPRTLFGLILSTSEIAWGWTTFKGNRVGGGDDIERKSLGGMTFLDEIVGGNTFLVE